MRKVEASRIDKIYTDLYKDSAAEAPSLQSPELGQQDEPVFWLCLSFFFTNLSLQCRSLWFQ